MNENHNSIIDCCFATNELHQQSESSPGNAARPTYIFAILTVQKNEPCVRIGYEHIMAIYVARCCVTLTHLL